MKPTALWKRIVALALFLLALALFLACADRALTTDVKNLGVNWRQFRREERDSLNVLFVGSSYLFHNVCPAELYRQTGYTSYNVGGPTLEPVLSWYYVREALRTQSPDVLFVELSCMNGSDTQAAYPEMNIGRMPLSVNRIAAALTCAPPKKRAGLLFPLYNYHDAWNQTTPAMWWERLTDRSLDMLAGYFFSIESQPDPLQKLSYPDGEAASFSQNLVYMERIADLCRRKGVRLVFCILPVCVQRAEQPFPWDRLAFDNTVRFFNSADYTGELGLLDTVDFRDAGHMNLSGAKKLTACIGRYLLELDEPMAVKPHDAALWDARVSYLDALADGVPAS